MSEIIPVATDVELCSLGADANPNHSITWSDISWDVDIKNFYGASTGQTKKILNQVSGVLHSSEMLAIMGPSGCGKTSLLDILADRAGTGSFQGEILFDGKPRSADFIPSYVAQEDSLLGAFTTRETLLYTASLTLPFAMTLQEKEELVTKLISDLGLDVCANTRVGDIFTTGLSGGTFSI